MTISSSLNAGISGLTANATQLASISENIANSSTYGYKRVQTDFHSLVISNNGINYAAGGIRASTQRLVDERGALISTNNPTDLAVRGRGMLPVALHSEVMNGNGSEQMLLTATGSFRTDANGYLTTSSGMVLLGWPADSDGTIPSYSRDTSDELEPVQVNLNQFSGDPTTSVELGVNLPATSSDAGSTGESELLTVEYYDNLGTSQSIEFEFIPTVPESGSSNEWTVILRDSASDDAIIGEYVLTFDETRENGGYITSVTTISGGAYDPESGTLIVDVEGGPIEVDIGAVGEDGGITQLTDQFAPITISKDGSPVGSMTSVEVDANGYVHAYFDTGVTRTIYQIPLVDLANPTGLIALDHQTYLPSPDSGTFLLWDAGEGPTGDIMSYALEESTTDVASELTSMIQTQRAYSSNAKVIQTVDEMLQETTNIKR